MWVGGGHASPHLRLGTFWGVSDYTSCSKSPRELGHRLTANAPLGFDPIGFDPRPNETVGPLGFCTSTVDQLSVFSYKRAANLGSRACERLDMPFASGLNTFSSALWNFTRPVAGETKTSEFEKVATCSVNC